MKKTTMAAIASPPMTPTIMPPIPPPLNDSLAVLGLAVDVPVDMLDALVWSVDEDPSPVVVADCAVDAEYEAARAVASKLSVVASGLADESEARTTPKYPGSRSVRMFKDVDQHLFFTPMDRSAVSKTS